MENRRVRKTGASTHPLSAPLLNEKNAPIRDAKHRLSVRQRKKRRKLPNEDEEQKAISQRSISLSSLFEKVLSRTPQIPEIRVTPPTEHKKYAEIMNDVVDGGLVFSLPGDCGKDVDDESHPAMFMNQEMEAEVNDSPKMLRWQKTRKNEITSDNDSGRNSPVTIKDSQDNYFNFCTDEEETNEFYSQMLYSIRQDDCKLLRSLLKKQIVDVNVLLEDGGSLLHEASYKGCVTCIKTLLKFGSYVNMSDDLGFTPLHAAVLGLNYDAIRLLIEHNALPNQVNVEGLSPCHIGVLADDIYAIHELMVGKGDPLLLGDVSPVSPFQMAIDTKKDNALAYFLNMSPLHVKSD